MKKTAFLFIAISLLSAGCTPQSGTPAAEIPAGRRLLAEKGCVACHSVDGQPGVGPTFRGVFGKQQALVGGGTVEVTEEYLKESIRNPNAKVAAPYQPIMPAMPVTDEELQVIVDYIRALK